MAAAGQARLGKRPAWRRGLATGLAAAVVAGAALPTHAFAPAVRGRCAPVASHSRVVGGPCASAIGGAGALPSVGALLAAGILGIAAQRCRTARRSYEGKTVPELKKLLRERGLSVSGKKTDLMERLEQADAGESGGKPAAEETKEKPEEKKEEQEEEPSPYGSRMPDPHKGKPEVIIDDEGRKRWLCLDGHYRRGDPESIRCAPENFQTWLSEWVVAARTGQCEGKPQMTFLPAEPNNPRNPAGKLDQAGRIIKSEDILVKTEGPDGEPLWEISASDISLPPPEELA